MNYTDSFNFTLLQLSINVKSHLLPQYLCICLFEILCLKASPVGALISGSDGLIIIFFLFQTQKQVKAYNTCCSQAVTHPSTGQAQHCLTSVIGREPVHSVWYGRRHLMSRVMLLYSPCKKKKKVIQHTCRQANAHTQCTHTIEGRNTQDTASCSRFITQSSAS